MIKFFVTQFAFCIVGIPIVLLEFFLMIVRFPYFLMKNNGLKRCFFQYVPEKISVWSILWIYSLLSMKGLSKSLIEKHRKENQKEWNENSALYCVGKYIENQSKMKTIQYGNYFADYNSCEVIALYNCLQYYRRSVSEKEFPEILAAFERKGISAGGAFGTNPLRLIWFLKKRGFYVSILAGRSISKKKLEEMEKQFRTFLVVVYNDKSTLEAMIHTMCITFEDQCFYMHNNYEADKISSSLYLSVSSYNGGRSKPILLLGIKRR